MSVVTDGPIFGGFCAVLEAGGGTLDRKMADCSADLVRLLEYHQTTAQRPGMLLGKVQSGKTRVFVGAIAIAFDSGFDIAVILTKPSKPLAAQTIRRLNRDLSLSTASHRVRVFNAASRIGQLNEWEQSRKLVFVAKKHTKNLDNLRRILLVDYPALTSKRVMIVDDEADFASVGYERRRGAVDVRRVQAQINELRTNLPNAVYLEVTATPYSLYLQPADIQLTAAQFVAPMRPAFTKCVPIHKDYIGGDFYFDDARKPNSVASMVHVVVPELELATTRQANATANVDLLTEPSLASLRRALITFVLGGAILRHDEEKSGAAERLFSFIVHLERLRGAHTGQQSLAAQLIDCLKAADLSASPVAPQIRAAYQDLLSSRRVGGLETASLTTLLPAVRRAFSSITTEVVNSDSQLEQLLDEDTGQLRQRSPFNIYIGGQSLDRGVTIANVIGFFYGRSPRVAQQDTTIQHCRMYGARPKEDLTVTRFFTSASIYGRMQKMHEFDQMLWDQMRARDEKGVKVDAPGDVVFLERDPNGGISPCSPNKIVLTRAQWTRPGGELVPRPFSTRQSRSGAVADLVRRLRAIAVPSAPFKVELSVALGLVAAAVDLIEIDSGWDWDLAALGDAIRFVTEMPRNGRAGRAKSVFGIYTLNNTIAKWKDPQTNSDPQRAPYSSATEHRVRIAAGNRVSVGFYHNKGLVQDGWSGEEFIWPVVFFPPTIVPTVFANNRRVRKP